MAARKRGLPKRVKRDLGVSRALSGKSAGKPKSRRFNKGKKHSHKRKTLRRGQPRDHAHPWIPVGGIKTIDRRAEAVAWAKKRRKLSEQAEKLGFLFNEEYVFWFKKSFNYWQKIESIRSAGRKGSKKEIVPTAVKDALAETFKDVVPGLGELYDEFRAKTGKYSFEDFQQWAKRLMETFKVT